MAWPSYFSGPTGPRSDTELIDYDQINMSDVDQVEQQSLYRQKQIRQLTEEIRHLNHQARGLREDEAVVRGEGHAWN